MAKQMQTNDKEKCRIITPEFRVSFPHVFKPQGIRGAEPKYSITMLFKKTQNLSSIKLAMKHAKINAFGPNKDEWPTDLMLPVIDGDNPKYAEREGYKEHWVLKAISNQAAKPSVVDEDVQPITDPAVFYPGCYARAQVFARVWEFSGRQGIHFILDHVQKIRDGKSFGGKKAASEVFQPIESAASDEDGDGESDDDSNDGGF